MPGDENRWTSMIDKLLPFLEVSPPWFRTWIYILIVLIGLTAALGVVLYLRAPRTLRSFSVDRPLSGEEVALPATGRYFVEGKFPILRAPLEHGVVIEVLQLPEGREVPQSGIPRINPVEGRWEHGSVQFAGEGPHEIVATARVAGLSVFRKVPVTCIRKAEFYSAHIRRDRRQRGAPDVALPSSGDVDLQAVYQQADRGQREFFAQYPQDPDAALATVTRTLDTIDRVLPLFPDDTFLQNVRAFMFKNRALVMKALGRKDEFERSLDNAEATFAAIRDQVPNDASAWLGLGNVLLLRERPQEGLVYIRRALELEPENAAAQNDEQVALAMIKHRGSES